MGFFDAETGKYIDTEFDENYYDETGAGNHMFHPDFYEETQTERDRRMYGELMNRREQLTDVAGKPITPTVTVVNLTTKLGHNNKTCEVWGYLRNDSPVTLQLSKLIWLGKVVELRRDLRPHELHMTKLYEGITPTDDSHNKAQLMFRREDLPENYMRDYLVEYSTTNDGYYVVSSLKVISRSHDAQ